MSVHCPTLPESCCSEVRGLVLVQSRIRRLSQSQPTPGRWIRVLSGSPVSSQGFNLWALTSLWGPVASYEGQFHYWHRSQTSIIMSRRAWSLIPANNNININNDKYPLIFLIWMVQEQIRGFFEGPVLVVGSPRRPLGVCLSFSLNGRRASKESLLLKCLKSELLFLTQLASLSPSYSSLKLQLLRMNQRTHFSDKMIKLQQKAENYREPQSTLLFFSK